MVSVQQPRIGIIGAGALGSYFGIRLQNAGFPVSFLLRSDYESVQKNGLFLTLSDGKELAVEAPEIYDSSSDMGILDWVVIGLKTTRNHLYKELLPAVVGPKTLLITIQNGIGNVEELHALFPDNPIVAGLCQIGVNREAPGRIRSFVPGDGFAQIGVLSPGSGQDEEHLDSVQGAFEKAGIRTRRTASLGEALWRKLMWNVPFNGLTVAIGGQSTHIICEDPALRTVARALMEEIRTAACELGYPIEPEYTDKLLHFTDKMGPYMSSSVLDWLAGRRLEVEAIFRKPLEAGTQAGVAMPTLATLTAILGGLGIRGGSLE